MMIAEESTAWPGVTRPISEGGLGFSYKWNMGWMHDTLRYLEHDPIHRPYHHDDITFGLLYAFSERFMLPLSHDEVALGFMWAHPGKKLLFMGSEIAQEAEWSHDGEVEWYRLGEPAHAGVQRVLRDLNRLYASISALHQRDCEVSGFRWVIGDDRANSVFAFLRLAADSSPILSVCNMTPVPRHGYRVGVPRAGIWREIFNSDSSLYGGSNMGNAGAVHTTQGALHGERQSLDLVLPPLSTVLLRHEG
jgi:1,4-alpha-glucan branching enzyme